MTRAEHLTYCKQCENRTFDPNRGILCKLTGKEADFEGTCPDYVLDAQKVYVPKPAQPIRPNRKRAQTAEYLIWACLLTGAISTFSSYLQHDLIVRVQEGFPIMEEELTRNDLREGIIGILHFLLYVVSAVFFIAWFRRSYFNLHSRTRNLQYSEGWAAGSWFVPILNLFRPYQIMKELDQEHSNLIERRSSEKVRPLGDLIGFWWAFWIFASLIGRYATRLSLRAETLEEILTSTQVNYFVFLFDVPLSLLAIFVIRGISKKEEQLAALEAAEAVPAYS